MGYRVVKSAAHLRLLENGSFTDGKHSVIISIGSARNIKRSGAGSGGIYAATVSGGGAAVAVSTVSGHVG